MSIHTYPCLCYSLHHRRLIFLQLFCNMDIYIFLFSISTVRSRDFVIVEDKVLMEWTDTEMLEIQLSECVNTRPVHVGSMICTSVLLTTKTFCYWLVVSNKHPFRISRNQTEYVSINLYGNSPDMCEWIFNVFSCFYSHCIFCI